LSYREEEVLGIPSIEELPFHLDNRIDFFRGHTSVDYSVFAEAQVMRVTNR
jgi:hypothetical protein